jgi:hypothetical protein
VAVKVPALAPVVQQSVTVAEMDFFGDAVQIGAFAVMADSK